MSTLTAWTGAVPRRVRDGAVAASGRYAFARWDGRECWVPSDRATVLGGDPYHVLAFGRAPYGPREAVEQPVCWGGWCVAHSGVIPNPDRLWMGRVPSGVMALLRRLDWIGRTRPPSAAVRAAAEMLGNAVDTVQAVVVGAPDGTVHLASVHAAGAFLTASGEGWAVASTSNALEGEPVAEGVTHL